MVANGAVVVMTNDWMCGVAFTILATFVGGASKLSIRKSWLITAEKQGNVKTVKEESEYMEFTNPSTHSQEWGSNGSGTDDTTRSTFSAGSTVIATNNGTIEIKNTFRSMMSPKQKSWLLYLAGMAGMSLLHPLCSVLAMKYANPSILAPFSGLGLVWIVLFSPAVVGESVGWGQKAACALIVAGGTMVAVFGDHTSGEEWSAEDVLSSYHRPAFRMFLIVQTLYITLLGIFICVCPQSFPVKKIAWGSIGGSVAGFQNFLKDALSILAVANKLQGSTASGGGEMLRSLPPPFFALAGLAALTGVAGLLCLAACMKRYDAVFSQGMFVVSFVVSASLMSMVHYRTVEHLEGVVDCVMYPIGLVLLFLGAFILVKPKVAVEGEDQYMFESDPSHSDSNSLPYRERLLLHGDEHVVFV